MRIAVVILAAGRGTRAGLGVNKLLADAGGVTVLEATADRFPGLDKIVVAAESDLARVEELLGARGDVTIVVGGATRCASSRAGTALCAARGYEGVLIHDGARPYLSARDLAACLEDLDSYGNAVMALPCADAVRWRGRPLDRAEVLRMATPQAFRVADLTRAFAKAPGEDYPDDATIYEYYAGRPLHFTLCRDRNEKITTADDFAEFAGRYPRTGIGYDEHRIAEGRRMILCGVDFGTPYGLAGHSDADAPVHALMDAMLSAAGLRDIGFYFPDSDPAYAGADSLALLDRVRTLIARAGYAVGNVSLVVHAERPRLAPKIAAMRASLADRLGLATDAVGITATSGEGMGPIGRGEGLAAQAAVTLLPLARAARPRRPQPPQES